MFGERYFQYDSKARTKTYCLDAHVEITHIYVYVKDNYSFNDDPKNKNSQYLGHWNKEGFILTDGGLFNAALGKLLHTTFGDSPKEIEDYLISDGLDKVVDARRGMIRKFRDKDVYYPVYNKTYNEWREKHNRGGDFMIYSKPKYMKLKKPINFSLETICRPSETM